MQHIYSKAETGFIVSGVLEGESQRAVVLKHKSVQIIKHQRETKSNGLAKEMLIELLKFLITALQHTD